MVPLRLIPPILMGIIIYPMAGLVPKWGEFFTFILVLVLFVLRLVAFLSLPFVLSVLGKFHLR